MPFRALASGQMLEVSGGVQTLPGRQPREVTTIVMSRAGEIYPELSQAHVEAYKDGEARIRALVEYGVLEDDGEGNQVFVPRGIDGTTLPTVESSDDQVNDHIAKLEAQIAELKENAGDGDSQKVDELEGKVTDLVNSLETARAEASEYASKLGVAEAGLEPLQEKVSQLETDVANERKRAEEAEELVNGSLSYSDLSAAAVKAEAEAKGLTVTRADGKEGEPLKTDYVAALEAARTS